MKITCILLSLFAALLVAACDLPVEVRVANYSLQNLNTIEVGKKDFGPLSNGLKTDYKDFDDSDLDFIVKTSTVTQEDELKGLDFGSKYTLNIFPLVWTITKDKD